MTQRIPRHSPPLAVAQGLDDTVTGTSDRLQRLQRVYLVSVGSPTAAGCHRLLAPHHEGQDGTRVEQLEAEVEQLKARLAQHEAKQPLSVLTELLRNPQLLSTLAASLSKLASRVWPGQEDETPMLTATTLPRDPWAAWASSHVELIRPYRGHDIAIDYEAGIIASTKEGRNLHRQIDAYLQERPEASERILVTEAYLYLGEE